MSDNALGEGLRAGAEAAQAWAHTRLYRAQAAEHEEKTRQEKALADLAMREAGGTGGDGQERLQQLAGPGMEEGGQTQQPFSLSTHLDRIAQLAAGEGLVVKAAELAKSAALIRQREGAANQSASTTVLNRLKSVREQADVVGQAFGSVKSQSELDAANDLYKFQTGKPSPLEGKMYSPALIEQVNQTALTAKERADGVAAQVKQSALNRFRNERVAQHDVMADIAERRLQLEREREARLAKGGGGKAVSSPAKGELDQASRLIGKDYTNMDAKDKNDAAFSVAADARALRRANPALDANTALQQAYNNAVKTGDFTTDEGVLGSGLRKKTTYSGRGKTAAVPFAAQPVVKERKIGKYYDLPNGGVGIWRGKGWEPVADVPVGGGTGDDDEEDDE